LGTQLTSEKHLGAFKAGYAIVVKIIGWLANRVEALRVVFEGIRAWIETRKV
jgi:hypothetical protein